MAVSRNGVIGNKGRLPFNQSEDLKRFRTLTTGKTIVMGSNTFRSLGSKPLPHRKNVVLTSQKLQSTTKNLVYCDFKLLEGNQNHELMKLFKNDLSDSNEVMIIGGTQIYFLFLPFVTKVYLTIVDCEIEGDTFFDQSVFFGQGWKIVKEQFVPKDTKNQYDSHFYDIESTKNPAFEMFN